MSKGKTRGSDRADTGTAAFDHLKGTLEKPAPAEEAPRKRRPPPPESTKDPAKVWIRTMMYPEPDLLSRLQSVACATGGLHHLAWRRLLDGEEGLTQREREWLNLPAGGSGEPQAWQILSERMFDATQAVKDHDNPGAQRLALIFFQLAQLAELAGSIDIVETALHMARGQQAAAAADRDETREFEDEVAKLWIQDVAAGNKPRRRPVRVHLALQKQQPRRWHQVETAVREAIKRLQKAGRLPTD